MTTGRPLCSPCPRRGLCPSLPRPCPHLASALSRPCPGPVLALSWPRPGRLPASPAALRVTAATGGSCGGKDPGVAGLRGSYGGHSGSGGGRSEGASTAGNGTGGGGRGSPGGAVRAPVSSDARQGAEAAPVPVSPQVSVSCGWSCGSITSGAWSFFSQCPSGSITSGAGPLWRQRPFGNCHLKSLLPAEPRLGATCHCPHVCP